MAPELTREVWPTRGEEAAHRRSHRGSAAKKDRRERGARRAGARKWKALATEWTRQERRGGRREWVR